MRMTGFTLIAAAVVGLMCSSKAHAESQSFMVVDRQNIENTSGARGTYLNFGDLSELTGRQVLYAKLYVTVAWDSCAGQDPELDIHVPTSQWNASQVEQLASWDSTSASIVNNLVFSANSEQTTEGTLEILLNEVVQAWADGILTKHALLLVHRGSTCDLNVLLDSQVSQGSAVELVVESVPKQE